MNEHEPSPERAGRHAKPTHTLDQLPQLPEDKAILALWEEGLARWGEAFVAYTTLQTPQLRTPDVLIDFETHYMASFDNLTAFAHDQLQALGWDTALDRFRMQEGIEERFLTWDIKELTDYIDDVYEVVRIEDRIHVFDK